MHVNIWRMACIAVLFTILTLGLWPFHSPKNDVTWLSDRPGLRFGGTGTLFGFNAVSAMKLQNDADASLEVWVKPKRMWDSGTFLTLYRPESSRQFSLHQHETDLELQLETDSHYRPDTARVSVPDVFRKTAPVFITLSSNGQGTFVYIDGVLAQKAPGVRLSTADVAGRVIVGDSPRQTQSWKGEFLGLAFYEQALTGRQVLNHYQSWIKAGRPDLMTDDRGVALYPFNERTGRAVHSQIGFGSLDMPEKYTVVDKICLEPIWHEFEMSRGYWDAALKNIIGFIPLGFCFYAYWKAARRLRMPALATIAMGAAVSFTIEFLQCYLPTRDSGTTDLVTNTAGTALGILLHRTVFA